MPDLRRAALAVLALAVLAACSGDDGEEPGGGATTVAPIELAAFADVVVVGALDVDVSVGPPAGGEVIGAAADVGQVRAEVEGETLFLRTPDDFEATGPVAVRLTTPSLDQVSVTGAGSVVATGVAADRFVAEIAGAGNLRASGTATTLTAVLGGAGTLALDDLEAERVDVQLIGTGNIGVRATETLTVNITGSGNVVYRGDPTVEQTITGTGTVQKAG